MSGIQVCASARSHDWRVEFTHDGTSYVLHIRKYRDIPAAVREAAQAAGARVEIESSYSDAIKGVEAAVREADTAAKVAQEARRSLVRSMKSDGLTHEDIAAILNISHQRVSQLIAA